MSLIEILVVLAILGIILLISVPVAAKLIRRANDLGALSTIRQVLAEARIQAIKSSANVVVVGTLSGSNGYVLTVFRDRANLTTSAATDGNFVQDPGEPTIRVANVSDYVHPRRPSDSGDTLAAFAFDKYNSDSTLTARVVFNSSGGIIPPQAPPTIPPGNPPTATGGRGIYFTDVSLKNYFRVTVESVVSGKIRVDKLDPATSTFVSAGWTWL